MEYWAYLLYKYPVYDYKDFDFDKLYNNEPYIEADDGALKEYNESWIDEIRHELKEAAGSTFDFLRRHVDVDKIMDWLLGKLVRDLAFYYDEDDREIRNRAGERKSVKIMLHEELKNALL